MGGRISPLVAQCRDNHTYTHSKAMMHDSIQGSNLLMASVRPCTELASYPGLPRLLSLAV